MRKPLVALAAILPLLAGAAPGQAATSSPNDPLFVAGNQWALSGSPASINAPQAWCVSTGAGVLIADVDTGASFSHPDLAGKLVRGAAFTQGTGAGVPGAVDDDNGHGTRTTGIMVAATNNGIGIAGVAPDARALVVKVLDSAGGGSSTDVAAGIRYAVGYRGPGGERVRVINLSLGTDTPALLAGLLNGADVQNAIIFAAQNDVAVAAAAGNSGNGLLSGNDYGQLAGVALIAGAVGRSGAPAAYSTSGNIYAPGGDASGGVLATVPGGYGYADGTSFAAPHVAGVLAQLIGTGAYNAAAARSRILATAAMRGGVPELDAAAALGAHGTCSGAAPRPSAARAAALARTPRPAAPPVPTPPAVTPPATPPAPVAVPPLTAGVPAATPAVPLPDARVATSTSSPGVGVGLGAGAALLLLAAGWLLARRPPAWLRHLVRR